MKPWERISLYKIHAAFAKIFGELGDDAEAALDKVIGDHEHARMVARAMAQDLFRPTASQVEAREIMGKNFFGIEDAIKYFEVYPSKIHLACLDEVPFPQHVLRAHKNTHILVAIAYPLSIVDMRNICHRLYGEKLFEYYAQDHDSEPFMNEKTAVGWLLMKKEPSDEIEEDNALFSVPDGLFPKEDERTEIHKAVYATIAYRLKTGERLLTNTYATCVYKHPSMNQYICIGHKDGPLSIFLPLQH